MLKDLLKGFAMLSFIFLCSCFLIGCSSSDDGGSGDDGGNEGMEYKMSATESLFLRAMTLRMPKYCLSARQSWLLNIKLRKKKALLL